VQTDDEMAVELGLPSTNDFPSVSEIQQNGADREHSVAATKLLRQTLQLEFASLSFRKGRIAGCSHFKADALGPSVLLISEQTWTSIRAEDKAS
jgi:hypothetical protein